MNGPPSDPKELLKRAFLEIRSLKTRLAAAERDAKPPVAIIGIGCRFPGRVDDAASFWRLLLEGPDPVGPVPASRWPEVDTSQPPGSFLDDVESFDAGCFEITPREAQAMDPQHRLLLETVWQALADAAIEPASLTGSRTGVFIGLATNDFARRTLLAGVDRFYGSGTSPAIAAGRIAYSLDLKGPCLTVDTACSSSLTAAHLAVQALRTGECDLALVGGVSLMLSGELGRSFAEAGMLAPDGRCKSFDAAADGYGRAEGVGVVVLRRIADAHAAGERVRAVIRGSAVNQDGRSAGLTAPNGPAQVAVIRAALADADVAPETIDLIEAHGSGTPLGDVIEAHALVAVFAGRTRPLLVGSVKSAIGHAEAAAGIAGLIKAALAIEHDLAAPGRYFRRLNPEIRAGGLDFVVPTAPVPGVRRVGVSSFGFSGSNAHVILERPPATADAVKSPLPAPVFRRERFPLPGAAHDTLRLSPDDPILAGTDGLAHLGVLLHLLGPTPRLEAMRFEQPLRVREPCEIRLCTAAGETLLESRGDGAAEWTLHLAARKGAGGGSPPVSIVEPPGRPVAADALYRSIEAAGFAYGDQARRLVEVHTGVGTAMGTLAPGSLLGEPGVIEAAAQLLYVLVPDAEQRPPMLAGCEALERLGTNLPAAGVWLRLRDQDPSGTFVADLGVLAADGRPIAWLESARFGRRRTFVERFGHEVRWERLAPPPAGRAPTVVLDGGALPWPGAASPAEARARLQCMSDPVLVMVVETAEPKAATSRLIDTARALAGLPCRLVLVTRGAVAIGHGVEWPARAGAAAVWGMAQALMAEQPERRCRLVDLDPTRPLTAQQEAIALECAADDEPAVAWRQGRRHARRLRRGNPPATLRPARAVLRAAGAPPVIDWEPLPAVADIPPGHVLIEVVAAGLNFRDRLVALGLRPEGTPLGADLAGIVRDVGATVDGLRPGDAVVALAEPALADLVLVPAALVCHAPVADFVAAATMPVAYATALAGLGELRTGASVLVHQAAGATGLAAVEVARAAGASVCATTSAGKQAFLADMGLEHIADSRQPRTIAALGSVDVAFGAFGPALASELRAERMVDLTGEGAAGFDLDALPAEARGACLARLDGLPPLPARAVPREALAEAIASVGESVGRTVVLLREPPRARIDPQATYVVTGAAGALGRRIARWLVEQGAAQVLMLDRAAAEPLPGAVPVTIDVADETSMVALFAHVDSGNLPLRGIFHAAAVTEDGPLVELDKARIGRVFHAKVDGARVLDRLTRDRRAGPRRLDHFVMLSSIVSLLPSASQGAYAAANAVLDRLAHERRTLGLAGLSLNLGPVAAGIGERMGTRAHRVWEANGIGRLDPDMLVEALSELLASPWPQRALLDIDWDVYAAGPQPEAPARSIDIAGLQALLAPIVGVTQADTLDPDTPLLSLGIDSLMAVEFAQVLGRSLGRSVPRTFVYSHPTLRAAAEALARAPAPPAPRPASVPVPEGPLALLTPVWHPSPAATGLPGGWQVQGEGAMAAALRDRLPEGEGLLTLWPAPPTAAASLADWRARRHALLTSFATALRRFVGRVGRLVWVTSELDPLAELLDGLLVTLRVEHPELQARRIVLGVDLADPVAAVVAELGRNDGQPLVLLRAEARLARRFVPAVADCQLRPVAADATYLVTGGSGGIGLHLARHLLGAGAGRVVLASRRGVAPDVPWAPGRLVAATCDLGDEEAVAALVDGLDREGPPLRGVFHLAGATADGLLAAQNVEAMAPAFAAKLDGAWLLDRATRALPLDHFVLFGSLTTSLGLAGAGAYAAANAALAGIARDRRRLGLSGLTVGWAAWQDIGMAAATQHWRDGSMPSYPAAVALAALDRILAVAAAEIAVLPDRERGLLAHDDGDYIK